MKNSYTEYICDYCGNAEHFMCNTKNQIPTATQARKYGWLITRDNKHFDTKECYARKNKQMTNNNEIIKDLSEYLNAIVENGITQDIVLKPNKGIELYEMIRFQNEYLNTLANEYENEKKEKEHYKSEAYNLKDRCNQLIDEKSELKQDNEKLTKELKSTFEEKNKLHIIIDRLLSHSGYNKDTATAEDFEDVYQDMDYKIGKYSECKQALADIKEIAEEVIKELGEIDRSIYISVDYINEEMTKILVKIQEVCGE